MDEFKGFENADMKVSMVRQEPCNFADVRQWMFDNHPLLLGHIEGCVIVYWSLVIVAFFMRVFRHKELGWVDIKK